MILELEMWRSNKSIIMYLKINQLLLKLLFEFWSTYIPGNYYNSSLYKFLLSSHEYIVNYYFVKAEYSRIVDLELVDIVNSCIIITMIIELTLLLKRQMNVMHYSWINRFCYVVRLALLLPPTFIILRIFFLVSS